MRARTRSRSSRRRFRRRSPLVGLRCRRPRGPGASQSAEACSATVARLSVTGDACGSNPGATFSGFCASGRLLRARLPQSLRGLCTIRQESGRRNGEAHGLGSGGSGSSPARVVLRFCRFASSPRFSAAIPVLANADRQPVASVCVLASGPGAAGTRRDGSRASAIQVRRGCFFVL